MSLDRFRERFETLTQMIDDAVAQVEQDQAVDLGGFDQDVQDFCAQIAACDPQQAQELKPMIAEMVVRLDGLAAALSDYTKRLEEQEDR